MRAKKNTTTFATGDPRRYSRTRREAHATTPPRHTGSARSAPLPAPCVPDPLIFFANSPPVAQPALRSGDFPVSRDRLSRVELLFTRKPAPLRPSKFSFEYLLLQPRSALGSAPRWLTPDASQLSLPTPSYSPYGNSLFFSIQTSDTHAAHIPTPHTTHTTPTTCAAGERERANEAKDT